MNARQENKLSMVFKIKAFFLEHLSTLSAVIPNLSTKVTAFNDKVQELADYEMMATENITGYAEQKHDLRTTMRDRALAISAGFVSFALDQNDKPLANKGDYTKSYLDKLRDTEVAFKCENLVKLCNPFITNLAAYGITTTMLGQLSIAVDNYKELLLETDHRRSDVFGYGTAVDTFLEDLEAQLIIIDGLIGTVINTYPILHTIYFTDRKIDDDTSGAGTPPNEIFTIPPGEFYTALSIGYLASRSFKAKNTSNDAVNWSLSTTAGSFSTPPKTLNSKSESNLLSSTLAPDGDILLFQNTSANPVDIEVTIFE